MCGEQGHAQGKRAWGSGTGNMAEGASPFRGQQDEAKNSLSHQRIEYHSRTRASRPFPPQIGSGAFFMGRCAVPWRPRSSWAHSVGASLMCLGDCRATLHSTLSGKGDPIEWEIFPAVTTSGTPRALVTSCIPLADPGLMNGNLPKSDPD